MVDDVADDYERISAKAYEIWESEGRPHGRDQAHWDQAKEIIALHDSMGDTLLPRSAGAFEPEEQTQSVEPYGDMPGITDQGRDDLTDIDREPEVTKPSHATYSTGDTAGHVARSKRDEDSDIDDDEVVTPAPKVAAVTPTPSNPTLGVSAPRDAAPREAVKEDPDLEKPQAVTPKTAEATPKSTSVPSAPGMGIAPVGNGAATSGTTPTPDASPSGAKAQAGVASASSAGAAAPQAGLPPIAAGAGAAPSAPDDAKLGTGLQASPVGNSAPVTGKTPPKPASSPTPVTKGRSSDHR